MPDTHDERGDEAALRYVNDVLSDENLDAHQVPASIAAATREVRQQLAAVTERADLAEAQVVETWTERNEWQRRALRDFAVAEILRADLADATARADATEAELGRVNKRADFLDDALDGMRQQSIEAVKARNEATARAEKAEARLAELGERETEQRIIGDSGLPSTPTQFDLEHRADWCPGVRLEERQVYATPWHVAADAAQDGLSATETGGEGDVR